MVSMRANGSAHGKEMRTGRLDDKVAIVAGANSDVGAAVAKLFAAEGVEVVMTARPCHMGVPARREDT